MGYFNNYLTSYQLHLIKHVRTYFVFTDTRGLTEPEIKHAVTQLLNSAVPIPQETYEWLSKYFKFVVDKDNMLVYDNTTGLWHYEMDDTSLRNMLTDLFTTVAEEAQSQHDQIWYRYAQHFFATGRISNLSARIKTSIIFRKTTSASIIAQTENLRYFATTTGERVLIDMNAPTLNIKASTMAETQPMLLTRMSPIPLEATTAQPTLWLKLLNDYMLNDPIRYAYFEKVLAYMMSPYNYNQVLIYFIGGGRNGKGTVTKVLQDILGPQSVRLNAELLNSKPSTNFKKDDALAATEGRSLMIFNEIDERMIASTQNIKDITEGGRDEFGNKIMTMLRPAYSKNYEVNICGIPLVVANSLINFGDWTLLDPIFKRLILVPFDFQITQEDPNLLNKLAVEYPKIQMWLYANYFKHKGINLKQEPRPVAIEERFVQYREDSDIIGLFLKDCIETTGNTKDEMLRSDFYRMYERYCRVNGRQPIRNKGTNGFQNLIEGFLKKVKVVTKNGSVYVQGVRQSQYFAKEVNNL